ncbi:MAG: FkbM family methyltransferase [Stellaceae bacterium]
MVPVPFGVIVPTAYGQMIVNRNDINQTNALFKTGLAIDHDEISMLGQVLQLCEPDPVIIDAGANFGTYSLGLAPLLGTRGKIHAFEPQRLIFNMLAGSIALNGLVNVYCYNMALGDHEGTVELPQFDYGRALNFGSIEFGPVQREPLTQQRGQDPARAEHVPLTTLDRFAFPRVDMIKIDVEGMELRVLAGAEETIRRCRPVMYVEVLKTDAAALRAKIVSYGYDVHDNKMNYLCIPSELKGKIVIRKGPGA